MFTSRKNKICLSKAISAGTGRIVFAVKPDSGMDGMLEWEYAHVSFRLSGAVD